MGGTVKERRLMRNDVHAENKRDSECRTSISGNTLKFRLIHVEEDVIRQN
jgi:hypothetical protein